MSVNEMTRLNIDPNICIHLLNILLWPVSVSIQHFTPLSIEWKLHPHKTSLQRNRFIVLPQLKWIGPEVRRPSVLVLGDWVKEMKVVSSLYCCIEVLSWHVFRSVVVVRRRRPERNEEMCYNSSRWNRNEHSMGIRVDGGPINSRKCIDDETCWNLLHTKPLSAK